MSDERDGRRTDSPYPYGWGEYRREVMSKLDSLEESNQKQNEAIAKLDKDMAVLSTRVMLAASALSVVIAALVEGAVKLMTH